MLGRTRLHTRARGAGAGSGSGAITDLERVLALSPAAVYWRALSPGTVNLDGTGAVATETDPVGRIIDLSGNNNHASAPADANRATLNATGWVFDGTNDYYSLTSGISVTTNMTAVRAFKRATSGIQTVGLAIAAADAPAEGRWGIDNFNAVGLGAAGTASTSASVDAGSFVFTSQRTALVQSLRRNGASVALSSATPPAVSGAFDAFGRQNAIYNNGEISFFAVFTAELTGADLALVEQIAAATNGAVLA